MTEAVLYQSVLQKLGQLSPQNLAELDAFWAFLVEKQERPIANKKPKFGFGKYKVEISDDFDAPLEDLKDESIAV
jgi:hypothetical protein